MWDDWWKSHRIEFYIGLPFWIIGLAVMVIWWWSQRKRFNVVAMLLDAWRRLRGKP